MMPSLSTSPISTRCWRESSPPQKSEPCPRCFGRSAITSTPWNNLADRATESTESGDWGIPTPADRPLVGREFPTMAHQGVHHRRTRRRNEGERGNHRHGNFRAHRVLSLDVYEFLGHHALEFDQAQALVEPRRHNQRRPPRIAAYR